MEEKKLPKYSADDIHSFITEKYNKKINKEFVAGFYLALNFIKDDDMQAKYCESPISPDEFCEIIERKFFNLINEFGIGYLFKEN